MANKRNNKRKLVRPDKKKTCGNFLKGNRPWEKTVNIDNLNFNNSRPTSSEKTDKITASSGLIENLKSENIVLDLVDILAISQLIKLNTSCASCKKSRCLKLHSTHRSGLASDFTLQCDHCGVLGKTTNSIRREYQSEGKSYHLESINFSLINAARISGFGRTAANRFFSFINMRSPPDNWVC